MVNLLEYIAKGKTYADYIAYVNKQLDKDLTTDNIKDQALIDYTKLNLSRKKRVEKTFKITPDQLKKLNQGDKKITLLVITEGWCGDAAQILPVISQLAEQVPNIDLKVVLREENPELMAAYMYNNTKSIPVVIGIEEDSGKELFRWGPRPQPLIEMTEKYKADESYTKDQFSKDVQFWYNDNKGQVIADEIISLINK